MVDNPDALWAEDDETPGAATARKAGHALMRDGNFEDATHKFQQAAEAALSAIEKGDILVDLADCLFKMKKWDDCIRASTQALGVNQGFGKALLRRAKAQDKLGNLSEALRDAADARKDPDSRGRADAYTKDLRQRKERGLDGARPEEAAREKRKRSRPTKPRAQPIGPHLSIGKQYSNDIARPSVGQFLNGPSSLDQKLERLAKYSPTSLDLQQKDILLPTEGLFSRVDFAHPTGWASPQQSSEMPPPPGKKDLRLLSDMDKRVMCDDDLPKEVLEGEKKKRRLTENTEAWAREAFGLQLPQLVTNVLTDKSNAVVGFHAAEKNLQREEPRELNPEDLTAKVDESFADAKKPPVHPDPAKRDLKPKRILSIVPDSELWPNTYQQILFDELPPKRDRENDLLLKTVPHPRITCFGYFSAPQAGEVDSSTYRLAQNYIWDNRGGFTRSAQIHEGEAMLWRYPKEQEGGESGAGQPSQPPAIRFSYVPTLMRLKKQKAARLDITLDLQSLSVVHRNPSEQEQAEEAKKMRVIEEDEEEEAQDENEEERTTETGAKGSDIVSARGSEESQLSPLQLPPLSEAVPPAKTLEPPSTTSEVETPKTPVSPTDRKSVV